MNALYPSRRGGDSLFRLWTGVLLLGLLIAPTPAALAANLTWDNDGNFVNGRNDGSGNWDTTSLNWYNGAINQVWNNVTGDTAIIGNGGTAGTLTLTTGITAGGITFNAVT